VSRKAEITTIPQAFLKSACVPTTQPHVEDDVVYPVLRVYFKVFVVFFLSYRSGSYPSSSVDGSRLRIEVPQAPVTGDEG
jgi:hypothetical protein